MSVQVCNLDGVIEIYPLGDCGPEGVPIQVYIPGPVGPAGPNSDIVDLGTRAEPNLITTALPQQTHQRERIFIAGNAEAVVDPTIPNPNVSGSTNATYELWLFCTDPVNTVTLNGASNLLLSGQWIGTEGSMICLIWDGSSQYVEDHRNEI